MIIVLLVFNLNLNSEKLRFKIKFNKKTLFISPYFLFLTILKNPQQKSFNFFCGREYY